MFCQDISKMFKKILFATIISLFFASQASAWEMGEYVKNKQAGEGIEANDSSWQSSSSQANQIDHSMAQTSVPKDTLKHHSVSFTYGIFTMTDVAAAYASVATAIYSLGTAELQESMFGAFSIDYGYKFNEVVEAGLVFNYAHPFVNGSFYTIMPKFKLNLNNEGFVNPFIEFDAGISITNITSGVSPMFHVTFLGLEIGREFNIILHLLSFGQRGVVSAGIGVRI